MSGNPLIIRHLGQKGFYPLFSKLNGKAVDTCSKESALHYSPSHEEIVKVKVG
jgi:hypothetical protein